MLRVDAGHANIAPSHRSCNPPGCRHDPVTDHLMSRRLQRFHALDGERRGTCTLDLRAHLVEHVADIDDVRLTGGVGDDGFAFSQNCRHQDVLGRSNGREVEPDIGTSQRIGFGDEASVLNPRARTKKLQPALVHIEWSRPDGVTTGKGNNRSMAAGHERPEHTDRGAELADGMEVRGIFGLRRRRDRDSVAIDRHVAPQAAKHLCHQRHVEDVGAVGDDTRTLSQQSSCHELENTVLRSGHGNFSNKPVPAGDQESIAHTSSIAHTLSLVRRGSEDPQSARNLAGNVASMAIHLTRIYTRTGDDGSTGLSDFSRVSKNDARLVAYADCDEANAAIGVALALPDVPADLRAVLTEVQNDLFDVGADLATPPTQQENALRINETYVSRLETHCDAFNENLPALTSFVLPGGTPLAAQLHVARTVTRRAERAAWASTEEFPDTSVLPAKYLNRLSDLLFILGRVANSGNDVLWKPGANRS